jgi:hypothetical protein
MKTATGFAFLSLALCCTSTAYADTFGGGINTFDIEFVTIGNPGNVADTDDGDLGQSGIQYFGSVAYDYRIGKFEISEDMINKANAETASTADPLNITHNNRGTNTPATRMSWSEAARFVNWLNTSTSSTPAYKFDGNGYFQLWQSGDAGYDPNNLFRNSLATYFLPSADEWYKAAYYDPNADVYYDYPTGSDTAPTAVASGTAADTAVYESCFQCTVDVTQAGGLSPYGTMGQGGNATEWEETEWDLVNDEASSKRATRGGNWSSSPAFLMSSVRGFIDNHVFESSGVGFRVASIFGLPGDFDGDGLVTGADFLMWQRGESPNPLSASDLAAWEANYGTTPIQPGDFDGNGIVDGHDFLEWQRDTSVGALAEWEANYGMGAPLSAASATVPEPTTCTLALAALCLAMNRRQF